MRIRWFAAATMAMLLLGAGVLLGTLGQPLPTADVAELNDLRARIEQAWPQQDAAGTTSEAADYHEAFPHDAPPLTVLDTQGAVRYQTSPDLDSELSAVQANAHVLPLSRDGEALGLLLVDSDETEQIQAQRDEARAAVVVVFALLALFFGAALWALWYYVLRPFQKLKGFAHNVAVGNFDDPLPMDRANAFGAFSESFDLMRSELRRAREAERVAREQNREVLAGLGHDIRTPMAVIAAASEVLELDETDELRRERLATIHDRTSQVNRLVSELIRTSSEDAVTLRVTVATHTSAELTQLIRASDSDGRIGRVLLPECLIDYDPARMRQVLDNVLTNARKFANGCIDVDSEIVAATATTRLLSLRLRDFGRGVPEQELDAILGFAARGSNSAGIPGEGLGLFIATQLMERMGGELNVQNAKDTGGFVVTLLLPLSGDPS